MTQHDDLGAFELRLQRALDVPLPAAPATLLGRLEGVAATKVARTRGRFGLILVPAAVATLLVAVLLGGGSGPRPIASASPSPGGPTGAFEPVTVDAFEGAVAMYDVWAVGNGFAGIAWGVDDKAERADLVRSEEGRTWTLVRPPRDGFVVSAGTPANGQVHVLGYTGTEEHPTWWHEAMDRDGNWREVGQVSGLPPSSHVIELTHGSSGWLARIGLTDAASLAAHTASQIRYSADGVTWIDPAVPASHDAPAMYTGVGTDGDALLVFRYYDEVYDPGPQTLNDLPPAPHEVLRTTDGQTWTVDIVSRTGSGPYFMAFDGQRFVGIGSIPNADVADEWHAAAWFSDGGRDWEVGFVQRPAGPLSDSLRVVTASLEGGFVAVGSTYGEIWTSTDGKIWQAFRALGPGETWNPYAVAVLRNEIVVAGPGADGKAVVWVRRPAMILH